MAKVISMIKTVLFCGITCLVSGCQPSAPPAPAQPSINNPQDANTTWRTVAPLDYQQAIAFGHCPISLPPEAKQVQFVDYYAGYGHFIQYVRFEAPLDVCRSHAKRIIKEHNANIRPASLQVLTDSQSFDLERARTFSSQAVSGEPASQAPWFDTGSILNGEAWGERGSHKPYMLIDVDRGFFYYLCSD